MIKRYRLITKINQNSEVFATLVPDDDGGYVLYDDHMQVLESIGAGGVSGRITQKSIDEHRVEFDGFCRKHGLNTGFNEDSGLFNSHVVGWAWRAWLAARGL